MPPGPPRAPCTSFIPYWRRFFGAGEPHAAEKADQDLPSGSRFRKGILNCVDCRSSVSDGVARQQLRASVRSGRLAPLRVRDRGPVTGEEHRGLFSLLTVRSAEVSGRACKKAKKWSFKLEVGASYGSGRVAEAGYPDSSRR